MRHSSETPSPPWRRHDLVYVAPDVWSSAVRRSQSAVDRPLVRDWADRGWPMIVRRRAEAEEQEFVPVGIQLPPAAGKRRVALVVPQDAVLRRASPPMLRAAAKVADPSWQHPIAFLLALGERVGSAPSVFGSLLWQHLTGLTYLSPHSDLDLLWPVPAGLDVPALLIGIAEAERAGPLQIDGEVIYPDGSAVNWRELLNAYRAPDQAAVLVKTMTGARVLDIRSLPGAERSG